MIQFDEHIFQAGWNHQLVYMNTSKNLTSVSLHEFFECIYFACSSGMDQILFVREIQKPYPWGV